MHNEINSLVGRELTDQELTLIQGGSFWSSIGSVFSTVGSAVTGVFAAASSGVSITGQVLGTFGRALLMGFRVLGIH